MSYYAPTFQRPAVSAAEQDQPFMGRTNQLVTVHKYKLLTNDQGELSFRMNTATTTNSTMLFLKITSPVAVRNLHVFFTRLRLEVLDPPNADATRSIYTYTNNGSEVLYRPGHCTQEFSFDMRGINSARIVITHNEEAVRCENFVILHSDTALQSMD